MVVDSGVNEELAKMYEDEITVLSLIDTRVTDLLMNKQKKHRKIDERIKVLFHLFNS